MKVVRFYHLTRSRPEEALPAILDKALERGMRAHIQVKSKGQIEDLSRALWADTAKNSFFPHGTSLDGLSEVAPHNPIWISDDQQRVNNPTLFIQLDGIENDDFGDVEMVCHFFDGSDPAKEAAARDYWRRLKSHGHTLTYWAQDEMGRWQERR